MLKNVEWRPKAHFKWKNKLIHIILSTLVKLWNDESILRTIKMYFGPVINDRDTNNIAFSLVIFENKSVCRIHFNMQTTLYKHPDVLSYNNNYPVFWSYRTITIRSRSCEILFLFRLLCSIAVWYLAHDLQSYVQN